MIFRLITITVFIIIGQNILAQEYAPIYTEQQTTIDTFYSDYVIRDPYQWLEDTHLEETKEWVKAQNQMSRKYLNRTKSKTNAYHTIDKYAYVKYEHPKKKGDYYFTFAHFDNHSSAGIFYKNSLRSDYELLFDPNFISKNEDVAISYYEVSNDSKYLAYQYSIGGRDLREIKLISLKGGKDPEDHLKGVRFSPLAWRKDGFYYSTFTQDGEYGMTHGQKVFYHKIGDNQENDQLIFERKNNPLTQFSYQTTSDDRFFILEEENKKSNCFNYFYIDYFCEMPVLKPLITNQLKSISILRHLNGKFVARSIQSSLHGNIVLIDPANPFKWEEIIPAYSDVRLRDVKCFNDYIVCTYQSNQFPILMIFDYKGKLIYKLKFPAATSISDIHGNLEDEEFLFKYQSYAIPPIVYRFNLKTFEKKLLKHTTANFNHESIEYKVVEFMNRDSIPMQMVIVHKKDLKADGSNPSILKAYGGFGAISSPHFDPAIVYFIKQGGVFAFANIRGGGDKGALWANAGKGEYKQNSFNDFIDAASYLIKEKYTNPDKLAITGTSNGGLVVATAAIQRPDLFKVVVPVVAPLDMIRFENFTVGSFHLDEYGTVRDSLSFLNLKSYSPLHNIKADVDYPIMLVITSENDDRVPPFHSYKFVATMQNREVQSNPVLLKVIEDAGHTGGSNFVSSLNEKADIYSFIVHNLTE